MFYHALTGNGGATPTEDLEPVLLWENSNPAAEFAAQTISLDLTDYAGVLIEFNSANDQLILATRSYLSKSDTINKDHFGAGHVGGSAGGIGRNYYINNSGVVFANAYYLNNVSNNAMIPTKIYGVKEYVVEPQIGDLLWTNPSPSTVFAGQKISVNLTNSKGVIVEFMISNITQIVSSRQILYKNDTMFGVGYIAGENATSRNITAIENDGVTFSNGKSITSDDNGVLIPYKIYAIN